MTSAGSHSLTELGLICAVAGEWQEAVPPVTWSHPDSSESVTEGRNSGIYIGDDGQSISHHQDPMHVFRHTTHKAPSALTERLSCPISRYK